MRAVTETARNLFVAGRHEAVISCGPPHMVHEAGRRIAEAFGVPLLLDLRDPWSLPRRLPSAFASPLWFATARHYERRAVRQAAAVVANTDAVRDAMRTIYPGEAAKFVTVMNGFDEQHLPPPSPTHRFVMAYAGGIYLDRNPRLLFRAAAVVIAQLGLEPDDIGFEFVGSAESFGHVSLTQIAAEEGISAYVRVRGLRPRSEALDLLARAQLLISLPQDSPWSIPSKVFEYMCFHAWVLALAQVDSPVEMLLRDTDADVVDPQDVAGMTDVIRKRYEQHGKGVVPLPISRDARFSRRAQALILIDALERSTPSRGEMVESAGASIEGGPRAFE